MWSPRLVRPLEIGIGLRLVPVKNRGRWLRVALEDSGPVGIKFGQFVSNRSDIFGIELSRDLAPLRDRVRPLDFEQFRSKIPPGITDVDPVPIACASIAQVHTARLKNKQVVIKFKRPGVDQLIKQDLAIVKNCVKVLGMIPNFGVEMATPWIEEFERGLLAEFDFKSEIKNLAIFREIYRDRPDVIIPRPYSKFSNDDVIVMDYVPSQTVTAPFKADRLINLFIEQLLYEGVIHGDLHTGNIGISGNSIVLYDFGNVIRIDPQYKTAIRDFVYGVQTSNVDAIMENMLKMGMTIRDNETARLFVNQYLKYLETLDIKTFSAAELQDKMNAVPVELDSTTLTILRSYTLLEGLAKEVDPELSYERILTKNVETLFLDLEYILYRLEKDSVQK